MAKKTKKKIVSVEDQLKGLHSINEDQKLTLTSAFSKSREGSGRPQLRRPEKKFGNDTDFLVKFENKDNKKNIIEEIKINLDKSFGNNFNFRRVENVGPKVSKELLRSGVIAISVALILMLFYIIIRSNLNTYGGFS